MKKIILASASPRRSMLLKQAGLPFEVMTADCDETTDENAEPYDIVMALAERKGECVYSNIAEKENSIIISADTIVYCNGRIYGKPQSPENALEMLLSLSGREHSVYTGVSIIYYSEGKKHSLTFYEETKVYMKNFDRNEALEYILTGEPSDKAGAYGIQGLGALLVSKIDGDYYNVVGLPICRLYDVLYNTLGIKYTNNNYA